MTNISTCPLGGSLFFDVLCSMTTNDCFYMFCIQVAWRLLSEWPDDPKQFNEQWLFAVEMEYM